MTCRPLWVILCRLPEKGRKEIEEIVEEMKERDREEKEKRRKVKEQKKWQGFSNGKICLLFHCLHIVLMYHYENTPIQIH